VSFDPSVNLGQLIEVGGMILALIGAFYSVRYDIALLRSTSDMRHAENVKWLTDMENELKKQTDILIQLAMQKTRIDSLTERQVYLERAVFDLKRDATDER
jgi:hypothetical protein